MSSRPTYDLGKINALIDKGAYRITTIAKRTAFADFGFTPEKIIRHVKEIELNYFYKTMMSVNFTGLWQDVYRTNINGKKACVKLQIDNGEVVVIISFKQL